MFFILYVKDVGCQGFSGLSRYCLFVDSGGVLFSGFRDCWFLVNFSTIWVLWIEGWLVFGHLVNVGLWRIPWILFYRVFRGCWFSVDLENVGFRVDSVELCFFWWTRKVLEFRVYLRFRSCLRFCLIRNVWLNKLIC